MKGILIICVGSSLTIRENYRRWAAQLVRAIKYYADIPVQVLYDGEKPDFGDYHTNVTGVCEKAQFEPAELKLQLHKYTLFEKTLYLDVDAVCLKDLSPLFELTGFQTQITGSIKKDEGQKSMLWAKSELIWNKYSLPDDAELPASNTSFIFFEKEYGFIFDTAYKLYSENPLRIDEMFSKWGQSHSQPDEFYINISLYLNKIEANFIRPIFFKTKIDVSGYMPLPKVIEKYYLLGCFGGVGYNHITIGEYYDRHLRGIGLLKFKYHQLIANKFFNLQKPNYARKTV